jgi:hypothetical protein
MLNTILLYLGAFSGLTDRGLLHLRRELPGVLHGLLAEDILQAALARPVPGIQQAVRIELLSRARIEDSAGLITLDAVLAIGSGVGQAVEEDRRREQRVEDSVAQLFTLGIEAKEVHEVLGVTRRGIVA